MDLCQTQKERRLLTTEKIVSTTANDMQEEEVIATNDVLVAEDGDAIPFQAI